MPFDEFAEYAALTGPLDCSNCGFIETSDIRNKGVISIHYCVSTLVRQWSR